MSQCFVTVVVIGKKNFFSLELNCVLRFLICNSWGKQKKVVLQERIRFTVFPRLHLSPSCDVDSTQVRWLQILSNAFWEPVWKKSWCDNFTHIREAVIIASLAGVVSWYLAWVHLQDDNTDYMNLANSFMECFNLTKTMLSECTRDNSWTVLFLLEPQLHFSVSS